MTVKKLTEHHLKILSLKGGCTGSSESTLVKIPHCWKSRVTAHLHLLRYIINRAYLEIAFHIVKLMPDLNKIPNTKKICFFCC